MTTSGVFESFYSGIWQQPLLLWLVTLLGTFFALGKIRIRLALDPKSKLDRFLFLWAILSILDAWLTANHVVGIGLLPSRIASALALCFVILGDLRVFWAIEIWGSGASRSFWRLTSRVLGFSVLVPILMRLLGVDQKDPRILFLVYELCFLVWILIYWLSPIRPKGGAMQERFTRAVTQYVLLYYGLWALADLWILFASKGLKDLGFALRVLPNLLYYGTWGLALKRAAVSASHLRE